MVNDLPPMSEAVGRAHSRLDYERVEQLKDDGDSGLFICMESQM